MWHLDNFVTCRQQQIEMQATSFLFVSVFFLLLSPAFGNLNLLIYGDSVWDIADDGTPVKDILGYYELTENSGEPQYVQIVPKYHEEPRVIFAGQVGWFITTSSILNDPDAPYPKEFKVVVNNQLPVSSPESVFGGNLEIIIDKEYQPAGNISFISCPDLNFTNFGGASLTFVSLEKSFAESQKVCQALDGSLAAPDSQQALNFVQSLGGSSSFWTGFYNDDNQWKWKVNDGDGKVFELSNGSFLGITGTGCLVATPDGFVRAACSNANFFVCQTSQHYFFNDYWTRLYKKRVTLNFAKTFCSEQKHHLLKRFWAYQFFLDYRNAFGLTFEYWIDAQWNAEKQKYLNSGGYESSITWAPGHPDWSLGECVVMRSDHMALSVPCNGVYGLACQYDPVPIPAGTVKDFLYGDTFVWISWKQFTESDAEDICISNNHEPLTIEEPKILPGIFKNVKPGFKTWVKLGTGVSIENGLFKFNSAVKEESSCAVLEFDYLPRASYASCDTSENFGCRSKNIYNLMRPAEENKCPNGFENMGNQTCLAAFNTPLTWGGAYATCDEYYDAIPVAMKTQYDWKIYTMYLYMRMLDMQEAWTGHCKQLYDEFPSAQSGDCGYINSNGSASLFAPRLWQDSLPFVCQVNPRQEEWTEIIDADAALAAGVTTSSSCIETKSNSACFQFSATKSTWSESCGNGFFSYNSKEMHDKLVDHMKAYQWFTESRAWIGLQVVDQSLRWQNGQSSDFSSWENDDVLIRHQGTSCVTINVAGFWNLEDCSTTLPSFCDNNVPIDEVTEPTTDVNALESDTFNSNNVADLNNDSDENDQCESMDSCELLPCPEEGKWSEWSRLHACSTTCGSGLVTVYRTCSCPTPGYGSVTCEGKATMVTGCSDGKCPIDGGWSEWTSWSPSNQLVCGVRNISRSRTCNSPLPSNGGLLCDETAANETLTETVVQVAVQPCPGDYSWGPWSLFTPCTRTCGLDASRNRVRKCEWNNKEFAELKECTDEETQVFQCGRIQCPIDGNWGEWSDWSSCSASCGTGVEFRFRFCNNPTPTSDGRQCVNSTTGSQYERQLCEADPCPPDRYQAVEHNFPHCPEETSVKTSIAWSVAFSGTTQSQPCPDGSVGTAYRKCSQNQLWMEEDLSKCVVAVISKLANISENSDPSRQLFEETMQEMSETVSQDHTGLNLQSSGDLHTVPRAIKSLLKWKPFQFADRSRSSRLEYTGLLTSTVEHVLKPKYERLWKEMDIPSRLRTFQAYLQLVEEASLAASQNLDYLSHATFETSFSRDLNVMLTTTYGWPKKMKFPDDDSPQLGYDPSYIELPHDAIVVSSNDTVRLTFTKYADPDELLTSLELTSLPHKRQQSFEGRKLNSAIVGVQAHVDGRESKEHRLNSHVFITFFHKRYARNPLCVFVDLDSNDGLFNSDGCEIWRKRENWTKCRCNHLTNFALLSYDVFDEELWWRITLFNFRSLISGVDFFSIALLVLILFLMFYAKNKEIQSDTAAFATVFAVLLRYGVVQMVLWFSTSQILCLAGASSLMYVMTLCCMWHAMRLLDVYVEVASLDPVRKAIRGIAAWAMSLTSPVKASRGIAAWAMSLTSPLCVILIFFLYDSDHQGEQRENLDCKLIFSTTVLFPSYSMCAFLGFYSACLLVASMRKFSKMKKLKKPIDAYRNEKQIWLKGFAFLIGYTPVALTMLVVNALDLPTFTVQVLYVAFAVVEVLYLLFSELWSNHQLRVYYYRMFRAKPPLEKVEYEPPKYIP